MATANTKRQSYTTAEKLKVIQFAEQHGNRSAQQEFDIPESNIRLWRRSKENLEKMPRLQPANHGKKAAWLRLKQDVMAWITEKRNNGLAILLTMIRLKAIELSKDPQYDIPAAQFKASIYNWYQRFMKRNGLSLRQKTTLAQRLPPDYEEKIVQFHQYVIRQRQAHNYPLHLVGNMDEVPVQFDVCKEGITFAPIVINNEELGLVNSAKLLGVTISNNLRWNGHINEIIKNASKRLYFLSQLKRARVAKQDLVLFYTSCICSILTYTSPVFSYALPDYLKNELERIQKRTICPGHCHNDVMELANIVSIMLSHQYS